MWFLVPNIFMDRKEPDMKLATVIMAAGMGTRMKSQLPKVLHPILGKPLLFHVLEAIQPLAPVRTAVVVGHEADRVQTALEPHLIPEVSFVIQSPQLGTGHALQQTRPLLEDQAGLLLTIYGDMPLLTSSTLARLVEAAEANWDPIVMLTVMAEDPRGFGRVVRDEQGYVTAIVEEVDCTPAQKAIRELNVGAYVFRGDWVWENLEKIVPSPKGEYYLTDLIGIAVNQGYRVRAELVEDSIEALGINNRVHLAEAETALRRRINRQWMEAGVTMIDPATTYIGLDVTIGPDTTLYPNTHLVGKTTVGPNCFIGPNSYVKDSQIGAGCIIRFSVVDQAVMEENVDAGPFAHLRKGAHLAQGVHMGNFGEVKNSYLGPGTKMGHFSYMGDATTGQNVNIGAGTITCNYDGVKKHPTQIGDNAFIGSDTMLVAPVKIGRGAKTGAGSVVTKDVPDDSVAYGVPARVKDAQ